MASLFGERAFLPNFLGKLPGGYERAEIEDSGYHEILEQNLWKEDSAHSSLLRSQTLRQFYKAIDDAVDELKIPRTDIERAQEEYRRENFSEVRRIVLPVIKYLHRRGYWITDLSGKHMIPKAA